MNWLTTVTLMLSLVGAGFGLDCYSCLSSDFDGELGTNTCYNPQATATAALAATSTTTCPNDTNTVKYGCVSHFTLWDGMVTAVSRTCVGSNYDVDKTSSTLFPTTNKCETTLRTWSDPTDTTECYYYCTSGNKCNSETAASLRTCDTKCNRDAGGGPQGYCNYITGTCVCEDGWEGADCGTESTAVTAARKCVQCNSETDSGCATSTTSVDCPSGQQYCSTATTTIFDTSDAVIRTVTTRGCATTFRAVDECAFTDIYTDNGIRSSGYNEFTCYSTCDTDGCNTNTADGVVNGNETIILQCVVCDDNGYCATKNTREPCPSGSTHCKATVTYLISNKVDLSYDAEPTYKLLKVKRECATAAVTKQCTEASVGTLSFKKVTCQETCQEDGCNIGWPARPTCLSCSSTGISDGYDQCLENPDAARACTYPYQAYCFIYDQGIEENKLASVQGYTRRITRGCSHYDIGNGCSKMTPRKTVVEQCNYTCTTDGCNVGSGSSMPIQTVLAATLPAIFGWLAQLYL